MATTPQIFINSNTTPDPYTALYSPSVLGANGNYVSFHDKQWIYNSWFLTSTWSSNLSSHYFFIPSNQIDLGVQPEVYGDNWIYSQHFSWMYLSVTKASLVEIGTSSADFWFWSNRELVEVGNPSNSIGLGWCFVSSDMNQNPLANTNYDHIIYCHNFFNLSNNGTAGGWAYITKQNNKWIFHHISEAKDYEMSGLDFSGSGSGSGSETPNDPDPSETPPTPPPFGTPPSTPSFSPSPSFEPSNLICSGKYNFIEKGRRCSIINGKYVYIGTDQNQTDHGQYNCHVLGGIFSNHNYIRYSCRFYVHCSNGLFSEGDVVASRLSDKRLKVNVKKIKEPTEKIRKINAVSFYWNEKQQTYTGRDIGLIAQEVEEVLPVAVKNRKSGFKAVQYHKIIPLLVGSVKDKQKRINKLKQKVIFLKNGES